MADLLRLVLNLKESLEVYQRVLALRPSDPEARKWVPILKERMAELAPADESQAEASTTTQPSTAPSPQSGGPDG
jgi:hypothetical protein